MHTASGMDIIVHSLEGVGICLILDHYNYRSFISYIINVLYAREQPPKKQL